MPGYSPTRWWSIWEVVNHLVELFGDVEPYLRSNERVTPSTRAKLLFYFTDVHKKALLHMEAIIVVDTAIVVDVGMSFVQATYIITLRVMGP